MDDMDVFAIRRRNLIELLSRRGAAARICARTGTAASYLSTLGSGSRRLGDDLARRIESAEGLPFGWLDRIQCRDHTTTDFYVQASSLEDLARQLASKPDEDIGRLIQLLLHHRHLIAGPGEG